MPNDVAMFELSKIYPHWTGSRIARMEAPVAAGLAKLTAQSSGKACLGFCRISTFDYDGVVNKISFIHAYETLDEAEADLRAKQAKLELKILSDNPGWTMVSDALLPYEVGEATGSIFPGKFPRQTMGRKYKPSWEYESIYARMYILTANTGESPLDQLLEMNGFQNEIVSYLDKLGTSDA